MDSPDPVVDEEYLEQIIKAHQFLFEYLRSLEGAPAMMLRFAWNDAGTYDVETKTGGANGSIRNSELIKFDKYRELKKALQKCGEVKLAYPRLTYADIIQLAGIVAVEVTGGPYIEFVPGRKDSLDSPEEGRIPAEQGIIHLHWMGTFHRMGLSGKDIVALSGGLSLGRKEQERWGYDDVLQTPVPLKFNNSYFRKLLFKESLNQEDLPIHPADMALLQNPNFRHYVELFEIVLSTMESVWFLQSTQPIWPHKARSDG
ncbi:heme peroxidase [Macleaya cordata]|uniref:Heme peroxidase n=1 Tax=Macleaya cordata TaxID=56857 RepID=A0A200RA88_MACCD|nr:heme peroxidase [Macleaya cordata]